MMRTVLISLAAAASALAFASPAAAQWYPPQPQPHGPAYGHQGNWGLVRSLQARLHQIERRIDRLDRRDVIREREASRLRAEAREIDRRLHRLARNGLTRREHSEIEYRTARLEERIAYVARDGHRWGRNDRRWAEYWNSSERRWADENDRRWRDDDDDRRWRDDDDRRGRGRD